MQFLYFPRKVCYRQDSIRLESYVTKFSITSLSHAKIVQELQKILHFFTPEYVGMQRHILTNGYMCILLLKWSLFSKCTTFFLNTSQLCIYYFFMWSFFNFLFIYIASLVTPHPSSNACCFCFLEVRGRGRTNVKDWENQTGLKVVGIDSADVYCQLNIWEGG